jgi:mRNA interferase RelE/StbE
LNYEVLFAKKADKDLQKLPSHIQQRIVEKIKLLREDLTGDVKHLTNFIPQYRLRVGDYRALFEISDNTIVIHRVLHCKDAY